MNDYRLLPVQFSPYQGIFSLIPKMYPVSLILQIGAISYNLGGGVDYFANMEYNQRKRKGECINENYCFKHYYGNRLFRIDRRNSAAEFLRF